MQTSFCLPFIALPYPSLPEGRLDGSAVKCHDKTVMAFHTAPPAFAFLANHRAATWHIPHSQTH